MKSLANVEMAKTLTIKINIYIERQNFLFPTAVHITTTHYNLPQNIIAQNYFKTTFGRWSVVENN